MLSGARTARTSAERSLTLPAKKAIEEVLKGITVIILTLSLLATAPAGVRRSLGCRFSIDVHNAGFQRLGYLTECVRELLRSGDFQLRSVAAVYGASGALYSSLDN